jgi:dihydrolipoamide dehydrogenase
MHTQVAVLGGGPGGYAAAFLAADLGLDVTIVEREPRLGGTCLLAGCIPSKTLLHVTEVMAAAEELSAWGVRFDAPSIHVEKLRARKDKIIDTLAAGLAQLAKQRKVRVVRARGAFEGSQTLRLESGQAARIEGGRLTCDHAILATGSLPVAAEPLDLPTPRVMDSSGALDLPDVPESLLVVGGGYIGLELGTVYARLGAKVTVVELTDGLLPGVDRDLVKCLQARLEKLFAAIHLNTQVARLADKGDAVAVTFEGEGGQETETYDRVLICVGRRPNSDGVGLENTRVDLDERGFVKVDQSRRTTDPHILAVGDVAGQPMLAHKAFHEGKVAAEVLAGGPGAFDVRAIPAVVFTDPEIAWAGLTETEAQRQGAHVEVSRYPWAASGRAHALGRTDGLTKMLVDGAADRVLGVGIVGRGAGELISEAALALEMGCSPGDIAETIHPHPTMSETLAGVADVHLGLAAEIYRPKRSRTERQQ